MRGFCDYLKLYIIVYLSLLGTDLRPTVSSIGKINTLDEETKTVENTSAYINIIFAYSQGLVAKNLEWNDPPTVNPCLSK